MILPVWCELILWNKIEVCQIFIICCLVKNQIGKSMKSIWPDNGTALISYKVLIQLNTFCHSSLLLPYCWVPQVACLSVLHLSILIVPIIVRPKSCQMSLLVSPLIKRCTSVITLKVVNFFISKDVIFHETKSLNVSPKLQWESILEVKFVLGSLPLPSLHDV